MSYYIYNTQKANGVKVIVDNIISAFRRRGIVVLEINSLEKCNVQDVIIPFGVKECHQVAIAAFPNRFALLVDAISMGYRNKIKFYLKKLYFLHYDFFYSIYGYLRYSRMEKKVVKEYSHVMLVSPVDIDYLKRGSLKKYKTLYHCVPNGANFIDSYTLKSKKEKLRLGILSSWVTKQTFEETNWFIQRYYKRFAENHPEVTLIIAGRGSKISNFEGMNNVEIMGEVDTLHDFFSSIDVFLTLNPKGCGILNRVLDSIAYSVPIAGVSASFTGFPNSDGAFAKFDNYKSFCNVIEKLKSETYRKRLAGNAMKYAKVNNDWERNYDELAETIIKYSHENVN